MRISRNGGPRHGATLVELLVVIVILAVLAGIVGLAPAPRSAVPEDAVREQLARARAEALRSGREVVLALPVDGRIRHAVALPDGSVIADAVLGVDRLAGRRPRGSTGDVGSSVAEGS